MATLKAAKRDMTTKAKVLRRQGKVLGSIYGKELPENILLQIEEADAARFLKEHAKGSQVTIELEDQKINAQLKDVSFDSMKHQYENVEFQALVAGEKVTSTAQIVLLHTDAAAGFLNHNLSEISYKAIPSALVEKIEIDVATMTLGQKITVGDLDMAKSADIELITPADTMIVHMAGYQKSTSDDDAEATTEEAAE